MTGNKAPRNSAIHEVTWSLVEVPSDPFAYGRALSRAARKMHEAPPSHLPRVSSISASRARCVKIEFMLEASSLAQAIALTATDIARLLAEADVASPRVAVLTAGETG